MKPIRQGALNYRELSPAEGKHRWRFISMSQNLLVFRKEDVPNAVNAEFIDASGKKWLSIECGINVVMFIVEAGYTWNGATPKRWVWPFGWVGTPDFQSTRLATFWHDVFCQFQLCEHMPLTRKQIDEIFCYLITNPIIARIYYAGVRAGGSMFGRTTHGEYSKLIQT
jgi:hypothetical protein